MMELYLHHGRRTPDEKLDNWGPSGPRLSGVKGIHQTYGNPENVHFVNEAAAKEAQRLTGWPSWDEAALTISWFEEFVFVKGADGVEWYFGDWGLMIAGNKEG